MIPVDSTIPIPTRVNYSKYPWASLKVGDSFLAPDVALASFRSLANYHAKNHGGKFTVRQVEGGVRVWRIA